MFQMKVLPPSSGLKSKPFKKPLETGFPAGFSFFHAWLNYLTMKIEAVCSSEMFGLSLS
jgi:hypothetical protein